MELAKKKTVNNEVRVGDSSAASSNAVLSMNPLNVTESFPALQEVVGMEGSLFQQSASQQQNAIPIAPTLSWATNVDKSNSEKISAKYSPQVRRK